jgi:hypothetical protein
MGSNELAWVRLEFDVLISLRDVRPLTAAERARLDELLGQECHLRGFDDEVVSEGETPPASAADA